MSKKAYGECSKSGMRVPVDQLVSDGQFKGLMVHRSWYEEKHPQEQKVPYGRERHKIIAPELSKPDDEGVPAPALAFDETGKLI